MEQPINQRIKFLLDTLKLSAREFSRAVGVADNNTQNYIAPRFAQPKADYLERVLHHFESINPVWLLTGKGEPFLSDKPETGITQTGNFNQAGTRNKQTIKGNKGNVIGTNNGGQVSQQGSTVPILVEGPDDIVLLKEMVVQLRSQLADKERIIQLLEKNK